MPLSPHPLGLPLFLRTLGSAGLYAQPSGEMLLGTGKPLALLVYVAMAPGRRTSRESLIDLLWSDVDPDRARNALRQSLFQLRRILGEHSLAGTEELTLLSPVDIDRDRFLACLEANDLESAIECYGGKFLPAFGVPGGAAFEQWADLERNRLQAVFVRGAELLVRRLLNQSRMPEGKQLARKVRDRVPHVEATGRLVLEASIADRDFISAVLEANAMEQHARDENIVLESVTLAAIARARRVVPAVEDEHYSVALVAELTGREQEFFAITTAWHSVRTGPARHLHLSASAGLGKTRLLRDAVARLEASGATVVHLRGRSGDRDLPYAFAGDLAAALAELPGAAGVAPASRATLLALNPALSARLAGANDPAIGDEALRHRILALVDLVHSVADEQRFVLVIDDLHWIDAPSYQVLEGVCSRLNRARVLCLTASRPERVPAGDQCTLLPLSALDERQVGAFVSALAFIPLEQSWTTTFISGLFQATHGSPLLVLETLRHALDQGILERAPHEWRCLDAERLATLLRSGEALRDRMRTLPATQLWLLALLATVGTPCKQSVLATLVGVAPNQLAERLEPLERQGYVVRVGECVTPTHDEIAEAARTALPDAQRSAAERCVGEFFARAGTDAKALLRAVRHFVAAGDESTVLHLFRRYAILRRTHGDRRPYYHLAAEFIGPDAMETRVMTLVRSVPRPWRIGLWSRMRQAIAVGGVVSAAAIALIIIRARTTDDATLQRLVLVDSTVTTRTIDARDALWDGRKTPIIAAAGRSFNADVAIRYAERPPAISPDGRSVAWTADSGDSTTLDIWLRTPTGLRRLTRERRDDLVHDWLPDGSALVGATDRWSLLGSLGYDIAVFDTATGAARQITHGPSHDTAPAVSPDGTRIAFIRESDDFPPRVCVITIDGRGEPNCRLINGQSVVQVVGWSNLDELVLIVDGPEGRPLIAYDWLRSTSRALLGPQAFNGRVSPDRRWVVAALRIDGVRKSRVWIAPIDHPAQARPVQNVDQRAIRWWEGRAEQSLLIDHIEFSDTSTVISLGIGTRLRVRAMTAAKSEIPLRASISWTSSDTSVATIDSLGEVRPRTSGSSKITASLVGWRMTQKQLLVVGHASTAMIDEAWSDSWPSRWLSWGDPTPMVIVGVNGIRGLWNNGDGSYPSMVISRRALDARHGLGIELQVSTLLNRTTSQRLRVNLVADIDTAVLMASDQRKSPPSTGNTDANCGISFPGPGTWGESRFSVLGGVARNIELGEVGFAMRSGAWWTLRMQILPDGRCAVAINQRVLWISPEPISLDGEFRVRLGDESKGTKLLHGPLHVWSGVRTDIDWTAKH